MRHGLKPSPFLWGGQLPDSAPITHNAPHGGNAPTHPHAPDLREAQNEYESLSFALRAAQEEGSPEKGALETKAKQARGVLLAAAARLAKVEEHAQVSE